MSESWKSNVGQSKSVAWPAANDIASNGNTGVAQLVSSTLYSIGYVELAHVLRADMPVAAIQNPSGNYVMPTLASTSIAAQSIALAGLPAGNADWAHVNLLNAKAADAYPIVSFSYILVYKELNVVPDMTQERAVELVLFLWYMVNDGQNLATSLHYAPLPANVVEINIETIDLITFNGQIITTLM